MGNNSIKNNLSDEDVKSEIKLRLNADIERKNVVLVVEGDDDKRFWNKFKSDNVEIIESYSGKRGVEDIVMEESFASDTRVIGVRDRDYQKMRSSNKVFFYDYSCLEMMIIKSDKVFQNLCNEYYKGNNSFQDLRSKILKELKYLSVFRMNNERGNWGLNFKGISIRSIWNNAAGTIDNEEVNNNIKKCNPEKLDKSYLETVKHDYHKQWEEKDYYNYTQGHDMFELFATLCYECGNKSKRDAISSLNLSQSARCCFGDSEFKKTAVYRDLEAYANDHNLKLYRV